MDIQEINVKAERLQSSLVQYSPENETAKSLLSVLKPLLQDAIAGSIQTPVEWNSIPGDRTFDETDARTLPGLEEAYAKFKFAITGGEPAWVQSLRERRGHYFCSQDRCLTPACSGRHRVHRYTTAQTLTMSEIEQFSEIRADGKLIPE